jgi:hypothetical protein
MTSVLPPFKSAGKYTTRLRRVIVLFENAALPTYCCDGLTRMRGNNPYSGA